MRADFPKTPVRDRVTTLTWPNGFKATTSQYGRLERVPHDLTHFATDVILRPRYGFWELASQMAPYSSLTPVTGRWPSERVRWFDSVWKRHAGEMAEAEDYGRLWDAAADDAAERWGEVRWSVGHSYTPNRVSPLASLSDVEIRRVGDYCREVRSAWESVPVGGSLIVRWPSTELEIVAAPALVAVV